MWHFCACVQLTYCYSRCQNRWSLRQHINLPRCQTYTSTATKLNTVMQNLCQFKARHRNCSQLKADQNYGHCELAPVFCNWGPGLTPGRTNEQTRLSGVIHVSHTLSKLAASHHIFTRRAAHTKTVAGFGVFTAQICIWRGAGIKEGFWKWQLLKRFIQLAVILTLIAERNVDVHALCWAFLTAHLIFTFPVPST